MKQPTILQIVPELDTGGAELSAVEIGEAVARARGRSIIATQGGRLEDLARQQGAEILRFPAASKNPLQMIANRGKLVDIIARENVALIHARSRAPAWSALWAARRAHVPFVTTYHGAYSESGSAKRFYNSVMARGDRVIANSKFTASLIQSRYGTSREKLRVIYRGVDASFDKACVSLERQAVMREHWGVGVDDLVVLQAARLTDWKGQRVLIAAAGELARRNELGNAVIILAGDAQGRDSYRALLERDIASMGLCGKVRLVGHVSDMAAAFAVSRISVVASTEPEAFGRAVTEAQALGCQVIATRLGAPPETVLAVPTSAPDVTTGWLVEPGNAGELATALTAALNMPSIEREAMATRAVRHVRENFTLEHMKRQTLDVYDELLSSKMANAFSCAPATANIPQQF